MQLYMKRVSREIFAKKVKIEKLQKIIRKEKDKEKNKSKNFLFIF